jgi:hypothetical protein
VFLHGIHDAAQALRRTLDDLFESGDTLQKMLVEGKIAFVFAVLFALVLLEGGHPRQNEELVLAAKAVLPIVFVECATGLAEHLGVD